MNRTNIIPMAALLVVFLAAFIILPSHPSIALGNYSNHYINATLNYSSGSNGTESLNSTINLRINSTFYQYIKVTYNYTNSSNVTSISNSTNSSQFNSSNSTNSSINNAANSTNSTGSNNNSSSVNSSNSYSNETYASWNTSSRNACSVWDVKGSSQSKLICKGQGGEGNQCCTMISQAVGAINEYRNGNPNEINLTYHTAGYYNNVTARMAYYNTSTNQYVISNTTKMLHANFIDNSKPTINITSPSNGAAYNNDVYINFTAKDETLKSCMISLNGQHFDSAVIGPNDTVTGYSSQIPYSMLNGTNSVSVTCKDKFNNENTATRTFNKGTLGISIDKNKASLNQAINFKLSKQGSYANIDIAYPNVQGFPNKVSFSFGNGTQEYQFGDTSRAGLYKVNATIILGGQRIERNLQFTITNNITCAITGSTSVASGDSFSILVNASGGSPPYTISDGNNNYTRSSKTFTYTITGIRQNTYNYSCEDLYNNKKESHIQVSSKYKVKVYAKDALTGNNIPNTTLTIGSYTNTSDSLTALLGDGNYTYAIIKPGYVSKTGTLQVNSSLTKAFEMYPDDFANTTLRLISPKNNSGLDIATSSSFKFEYNFSNYTEAGISCDLSFSSDGQWFAQAATNVSGQTKRLVFTVSNSTIDDSAQNNTFYARASCTYNSATIYSRVSKFYTGNTVNTLSSAANSYSLGSKSSASAGQIDIVGLLDDIATSEKYVEGLPPNAKDLVGAVGIDTELYTAQRDVTNIRRDLFSLQQSNAPQSQIQDNVTRYYTMLDNISKNIVKNITILSADTFVQYPTSEDIASFAQSYYTNMSAKQKAIDEYLGNIQKSLSVTTKVIRANVQYSSHSTNYTAIIKQYSISNSTANYKIIEDIKGSKISGIGSIHLPPDYQLKGMSEKNGYLVMDNLENNGTYSYYTNSLIGSGKDGVPKQYLVEKNPNLQTYSGGGITGFVTYSFSNATNSLLSLIAIIFIALLGYGIYSGKAAEILTSTKGAQAESARIIRRALDEMSVHIRSEDYDDAFLNYEEVALQYRNLNSKQETVFYPEISASYLNLLSAKGTKSAEEVTRAIKGIVPMDIEEYSVMPSRQGYPRARKYDVKSMKSDFMEKAGVLKTQYKVLQKSKSMLKEAKSVKKNLTAAEGARRNEMMAAIDAYGEFARHFEKASDKFTEKYGMLKSEFKTIRKLSRMR